MKKKKIIFKEKVVKKDAEKEKLKTQMINNTLIDIRKYYLKNIDQDKKLKFKLAHFNKVLKNQGAVKSSEFIDTFVKLEKWGFDDKN